MRCSFFISFFRMSAWSRTPRVLAFRSLWFRRRFHTFPSIRHFIHFLQFDSYCLVYVLQLSKKEQLFHAIDS